jgi:cobyrinic acid a,c-diamide synthase
VTPRVVIAGVASGAGKTSVACGLIGALRRAGLVVQGFKVGPDYIDPSYHALAAGRPGRNLDAFLSGPDLIAPLFRHGAAGADLAVVEGVMGLFDGASGRGELASTAQVAKLLRAPVVLVVDAAAMARSVAAIVHGYRTFDPDVHVAAVILNRVGSPAHAQLLKDALDLPVLGAIPRDDSLKVPERHLGLVPATERAIGHLAAAIAEHCDLDGLVALARTAPEVPGEAWSPDGEPSDVRIAIARGPAFSFHYEENLELLRANATLVEFDPLNERLPDADALILAGGFPETFGEELSANAPLREDIASFRGPILAECGGLLYLARELDGRPMCGVLDATATMTRRLKLGYREVTAQADHPVWPAGTTVRGHEFHYSAVEPGGDAWERTGGHVRGLVHASFLHTHWAATPGVATRLVAACG